MNEPDEIALMRDAERALRAEHLLKDELLQEAFTSLEAEYFNAWRLTGTAEAETFKRERLWQAINLLGKVKEHLTRAIEGGKMARAQIIEIEGRRRKVA